jgi:hypothetical protein
MISIPIQIPIPTLEGIKFSLCDSVWDRQRTPTEVIVTLLNWRTLCHFREEL